MMKQGIIFDMDGTLWDSAENVAKSWNMAVNQSGLLRREITAKDIQGVMGKTMDAIADILFAELGWEDRKKLLEVCCEVENNYLRQHGGTLYDGVEETFCKLRAQGYHLYIVSNCQKGYIEAFLDYYKLWGHVEDIACYGNNLRPKGENIRLLAERNDLDTAVYVGDIQGDYDASCAAGVGFVHAAYGFGTIDAAVPRIRQIQELAGLDLAAASRRIGGTS
ncbi:MAG: HAD family hydrolase [Roseburia sp.]